MPRCELILPFGNTVKSVTILRVRFLIGLELLVHLDILGNYVLSSESRGFIILKKTCEL